MPLTLLSLVAAPLLAMPQTATQGDAQATEASHTTFSNLQRALTDRRTKWMTAYRKATPEARAKLGPYPSVNDFLDRAWKLVDPDPTTTTAGDVLCWIVSQHAKAEASNRALALLQKHHLAHDDLGTVCASLQYQITPQVEGFLRAANDSSPSAEIRNQALYALARVLMRRAGSIDSLKMLHGKERDERIQAYKSYYGPKTVVILEKEDSKQLRKQAEKYLDQLVATADDTGKGSIVARAKRDLYELRNLAIGMKAPEITGQDVDGVEFKLSDYLGKVVVLDFWGDW